MNDRPQGGTSMNTGEIELMVNLWEFLVFVKI
jgi:hypothetical protein